VSRSARLGVFIGLLGIVVALVVFTTMAFLRRNPPNINFVSGHAAGQPVDLMVQTVPSIGFGVHPTWVSYMVRNEQGRWVHSTLWQLPAHTRINVTIDQFDSGSPLRNQQVGQITGTIGGTEDLNGKAVSVINANVGNGVGHTFSVPTLGINVPLPGISGSATNTCSVAPCSTKFDHNQVQFSFVTPGAGQYPFQCFVPCGLGYLFGNGGPMQTIGYMDGFLKVVA
jgi:hypothetical protein